MADDLPFHSVLVQSAIVPSLDPVLAKQSFMQLSPPLSQDLAPTIKQCSRCRAEMDVRELHGRESICKSCMVRARPWRRALL